MIGCGGEGAHAGQGTALLARKLSLSLAHVGQLFVGTAKGDALPTKHDVALWLWVEIVIAHRRRHSSIAPRLLNGPWSGNLRATGPLMGTLRGASAA